MIEFKVLWLVFMVCSAFWIIIKIIQCRIDGPEYEHGVWIWKLNGSVIAASIIFITSLIVLLCLLLSSKE